MPGRRMWNVRLRHESLRKPITKTHVKRRLRLRCGLEAALQRKIAKAVTVAGDAEKS